MKLAGIRIQKYRSIKDTGRLNLGELTVLVGPNNEGKSNILRAVALSMRLLRRFSSVATGTSSRAASGTAIVRSLMKRDYEWSEDFPKTLQERSPEGNTIVDLWFELSDAEKEQFHESIGVRLRTELPIRLTVNRRVEFTVRKQGPGRQTLMRRAGAVAAFIGSRLRVEYVPSVRTAATAGEIVKNMLEVELEEVLQIDDYKLALETLASALSKTLEPISTELTATLSHFLPEVREVSVEMPLDRMVTSLVSGARILVDDGVMTDLSSKGDGVQSLAAMALARKAASVGHRSLLLAIEEPEAHLHPRAIHQVRGVLHDIVARQQVVVTTHSPLLVDRFGLSNNIVVTDNKARPATDLQQLREALGVRAADNLSSASLVVLVEGLCDERAVKGLLSVASPSLELALKNGVVAVESLSSASNLSVRLEIMRQQICRYIVLLDNDTAGQEAATKARKEGLLSPSEEIFAIAPDLKESEFEDCIDPALYQAGILTEFGVDLKDVKFRKGKKKWSGRIEDTFRSQGKHFDNSVKVLVKTSVAGAISDNPAAAMHPARSTALAALIREVERQVAD